MVDEHTRKEVADILCRVGPTDKVRAERLGVNHRTMQRWRREGRYPREYRHDPVAMFTARVAALEPVSNEAAMVASTIPESSGLS